MMLIEKIFQRKSHHNSFVEAFLTNECGSLSRQVEEPDHCCILNR